MMTVNHFGFVFGIMAVVMGCVSGRDLGPRSAPEVFKTEYYKIYSMLVRKEIDVFKCFAVVFFQDSAASLNLDQPAPDSSTETTPAGPTGAPATPADTTPISPAARSAEEKRQSPPAPAPLEYWQVSVINRLLDRYHKLSADFQFCQEEIARQQRGQQGGPQ